VVAKDNAEPPPAQEPRQALFTVKERHAAKVFAVELKQVEGVHHGLGDGAPTVELVENGDTIRPAHHCLAVECE
jgi:hypothetical protein